jgi:predicted metalloprotease
MKTRRVLIVLIVVLVALTALVVLIEVGGAKSSQPVVTQKETPAGTPDRNVTNAVVKATWDWMRTHTVATVEPMWTGPGYPPTFTPAPTIP